MTAEDFHASVSGIKPAVKMANTTSLMVSRFS
jgi:hypothetical protein